MAKLTRNDVLKKAEELRNWGKWGPDDELGVLNYVTPQDIVNAARLFALDADIAETSSIGRLSALESSGYADPSLLSELQQAFEFLTLLRLEHQLQQARAGKPLDNYIRPERLSHLQKSLLKESFRTIGRAQSLLEEKFRTAVWAQLDR